MNENELEAKRAIYQAILELLVKWIFFHSLQFERSIIYFHFAIATIYIIKESEGICANM